MLKLFLITTILSFSFHSFAQKQAWKLDRSHSSITFAIDHMVISETTGKFDDFSVDVKADKADFTDAKFTVSIPVNSINTDNEKRDAHLKNKDFFDTKNYPNITFVGKSFKKVKGKKYQVVGDLTMHGVTKKNVVLDGKFNGIVKDPWGNMRAGLKVTGELDRYDYGLKYNSVLEAGGLSIGKEVRITANIELIQEAKKK